MDAHRGAFEYDWRTRFHQSLRVVGRSMTWGEADRLTRLLAKDTSSQVGAALTGWQYPASRQALAIFDLYDALAGAHYKRPKKYPRPWDAPPKQYGRSAFTIDQLRGVLDHHRGMTSHRRDSRGRLRDSGGRFIAEQGGEVRRG